MTDGKADILIVEDEQNVRDALKFSLEGNHNLHLASDGKQALDIVAKKSVDLVLLDLRLPEVNGMEVLEQIKSMDNTIPVIMLTGDKTVDSAVTAMKLGAYDYIVKPFDIKELLALIGKALEKRRLEQENIYLKTELEKTAGFEKIIGSSKLIKEVFTTIKNVAKSDSTILITGESGTGKELVARAIHNQSNRAKKLFVPVNCAAIPDNLLESELFGYERGAFTGALERKLGKFELADGGTIFLDEISLMPLPMQAKLLRVLQEHVIDRVGGTKPIEINVRVIAASNSDLKQDVENRKFRNDLFYRLNVIPIHLPPLRERKEDIPLLIQYFIGRYNKKFGKKISGVTKDALEAMSSYGWPGNIRELENLLERMIVLGDKDVISIDKLPPEISQSEKASHDPIKERTHKFELDFINKVLEKTNLNERQIMAIQHVKDNGRITKQGYIELTKAPKTTAFRDLSALVKLNILSQKGTGKSSYYTLVK